MPSSSKVSQGESVKVVVRVRPLSSGEEKKGYQIGTRAYEDRGVITVVNPKSDEDDPPKTFTFDAVFDDKVTQRHVYEVCAAELIEACLTGYNGTFFAYGQTGAGKSHTMELGIIPNAFVHIFDKVNLAEPGQQFLIRASYIEIYNEEVHDLLAKDPNQNLELRENTESGFYIKDLSCFVVKSVLEIDQLMQAGKKNRSTGSTDMNEKSSRGHSMFTIICEYSSTGSMPTTSKHHTLSKDTKPSIRMGKLNLVDLAGSERQGKTGATGQRLVEANNINKSLSALSNVISALVDGGSSHVRYRDSKLTKLLKDSLGGNTKTVMCANVGPATYNYEETVSTLRYANRAKNIKNKPKINEDPKEAMLREFQEEIEQLKSQLQAAQRCATAPRKVQDGSGGVGGSITEKIVEKIVEVERLVEVKVGASPEEMAEYRAAEERAIREKEELRKQAAADMKQLLDQQTNNAKERVELESRLLSEQHEREVALVMKQKLEGRLKQMEAKLIHGGKLMDKAIIQEAELRAANLKLAQKQEEDRRLQVELRTKEDLALHLEDQFSSMQDEVDIKTKKLKKLWAKYQELERAFRDEKQASQREKEELLADNRELSTQLKLKSLILDNFVPEHIIADIESRVVWSERNDEWTLPRLDIAGNCIRPRRPVSLMGLRRPESEFSRNQRQQTMNTSEYSNDSSVHKKDSFRYRQDNILNIDFEQPKSNIQEYKGSSEDVSNYVRAFLSIPLLSDDLDRDEVEVVHCKHSKTTDSRESKERKKMDQQKECFSEPKGPYHSYEELEGISGHTALLSNHHTRK